jgi:hypothetical protein
MAQSDWVAFSLNTGLSITLAIYGEKFTRPLLLNMSCSKLMVAKNTDAGKDQTPSIRYRPVRKPKVLTNIQYLQKQQNKLEREISKAKTAQKALARKDSRKVRDSEFDQFLGAEAEQQGLFDTITAPYHLGAKAVDSIHRISVSAERMATLSEETVAGVSGFFEVNRTKLMTQVGLAIASIGLVPKVSTVVLEILKILVNYTTVLDNITEFLAQIWTTIKIMIGWALGTNRPEGSFAAVSADMEGDDPALDTTSQFWNTAGLAAGVGTLIGASLLTGVTSNVKDLAFSAYKRAAAKIAQKKAESALESFMETCVQYIKSAFIQVFPEGTFIAGFESWLDREKIDLPRFVARVGRMLDPTVDEQVLDSPDTRREIDELVAIALQIENGIMTKKIESQGAQLAIVRSKIRDLATFALKYNNSHMDHVRDTPYCVMLHSKPGVGKSILTKPIAYNLCAEEHGCTVTTDKKNFLYSRSSCDKYYTNYRGQSVFIVDDFGQSKAASADNSEFRDFIAIISATPFAPPKAAVEEKGEQFKSKLYIATTNNPFPNPTEIVEPTAIHRRRNALWEVVVRDPNLQLEDMDRYGFYRTDKMENKRLHKNMKTFEDMILEMIPEFNAWDNKNQSIKSVGVVPFKRSLKVPAPLGGNGTVSNLVPESATEQGLIDLLPSVRYNNPLHAITQRRVERETSSRYLRAWCQYREHVTRGIEQDLRQGYQLTPDEAPASPCLCCAGWSCAPHLPTTPMICVPENYWGQVPFRPWQLMDTYNDQAGRMKYYMCFMDKIIYRDGFPFHKDNYEEWKYEKDICRISRALYEEEHDLYAHYMSHDEYMRGGDLYEEEVISPVFPEEAEAQVFNTYYRLPTAYECVRDYFSRPLDTQEASAQLDEARAQDETTVAETVCLGDRLTTAQKVLVKVLGVFATCWLSYKAYKGIRSLFGIAGDAENVTTKTLPNGALQKVIDYYPLNMRSVVGAVLKEALIGVTGDAVGMILQAEGGAAAYGEAATIKHLKRNQVRFTAGIRENARKMALSAGIEPWNEARDVRVAAEAQGCSDENGLDLVTNKLGPRSVFTIERDDPLSGGSYKIKGFGLTGRLIAVPWHFIPKEPTVLKTTIYSIGRKIPTSIDYRKAVRVTNGDDALDLAFIELGHEIESFPDVVKHFVREAELSKLHRFKSMLIKHQTEAGGYFTSTNYIDSTSLSEMREEFPAGFSYGEREYSLLTGYAYKVPTTKGDCGALLVALDSSLKGRIVGFHVAGHKSSEQGLSAPITHEILEQNIKQHFPNMVRGSSKGPTEAEIQTLEPEEALQKIQAFPKGEVELMGVVVPRLAQRFPMKTDIVPSMLFDKVFPHKKEPAVLSPSDPRIDPERTPENYLSPMDEACGKYAVPITPFKADLVDLGCALLKRKLQSKALRGMPMRLLTDHETINGNIQAGYTGMDMSTSPGMPWKNFRPHMSAGKHIFFKTEEDGTYIWDLEARVYGVNPASVVLTAMTEWETEARANRDVPFSFNYENLKQETVSMEKIATGKTRTFSCTPLHLSLLFRKYFGAWIALTNQNCSTLPSAIGINPEGGEWTLLAKRLLSKGDCMIAGDYQKWDGRLSGAVMGQVVREVVNPMYREHGGSVEDDRVREKLIEYAIHTPTLVGNALFQKHQGMPSGLPITGDVNGAANAVYLFCNFAEAYAKHRAQGPCENCKDLKITDFFSIIEITVYGDDHIASVGNSARCFWNFNICREIFLSHGIGYTDSQKKGGECPDFQKLSELTFLKREFVEEDGLFLAPLERESVEDQLNWIRIKLDPLEATLTNADTVMRQMVPHGRTAYDEAARKVTRGLETIQRQILEDSSESFTIPIYNFDLAKQEWRDNLR